MVWSTIYDNEETPTTDFHCAPPKQLMASVANSFLDHACELDINSAPSQVRLTGIACTIGPSSTDPAMIEKMMENGMNIARINFSIGTHEIHEEEMKNVRIAADNYSKKLGVKYPIAIALDIKGPEIRLGCLEAGKTAEVTLVNGEQFKLTTDKAYSEKGSASIMFVDYENIQRVVPIGNKVYIDHGLISLICTSVQGSVLTCTIENGGPLRSYRGVNLPGVELDLPVVSAKDKEDLIFGVKQGIDIIFVSFVRSGNAISEIRDALGPEGNNIMIVSKIENQQGMQNVDGIIKVSDGIMIARGDLGIELPVEKLFLAQKSIIAKCNKAGKPVMCAFQMLESMTTKPRPTRSECTDVANAVLDGADCLLLSGETARGIYPVETIRVMATICKEAEAAVWHKQQFIELLSKVVPPLEASHAVAIAAVEAAAKCLAAAILVITTSGLSGFLITKYRPNCPIILITRNLKVARQAHLYRGLLPLYYPLDRMDNWTKDLEARFSFGISFGKWKGFIRAGDPVVCINGSRKGSGFTDTLRILYVAKPLAEGEPCGCD